MNVAAPVTTNRGFALLSILLLLGLASVLVAAVHLHLRSLWRVSLQSEARLHSQVLAEDGVEWARSLLPGLEIGPLLTGSDSSLCPRSDEWRNPMPLAEARRIDPADWSLGCDDGIPARRGAPDADGAFLLRFSNNPEEPPDEDRDGIVLARSMGLAPLRVRHPLLPQVRNSVTLIEARLRQERAFFLEAALNLFAEGGSFDWQGDSFVIDGGDSAAVAWASLGGDGIEADLLGSLTPSQASRLVGESEAPSIRDDRLNWLQSKQSQRRFLPGFWQGFEQGLPNFDRGLRGGLAFLEAPGEMEIDFEGFLAIEGPATLAGDTRIRGLLIHLGEGKMELEGRARVEGAVWLSNLQTSGANLSARPVEFEMADQSSIVFDPEAVLDALAQLPPTQLGWRIVFPEMQQ